MVQCASFNVLNTFLCFSSSFILLKDTTMQKLNQILKALMAEIRINESELARRTGIGQPVIHRIASGETDNPKVGTLSPIAKFFALSISQLIGDEPLPPNRIPGTFNPSAVGWKQLPLLSWEQAFLWPHLPDTARPTRTVSTDQDISKNAFGLVIKDNTMEPRFPEGTLLIVDPELKIQNCDFAIVYVDGQKQPTFKQVLIDGEAIYLKPLNADFKTTLLDKSHKFLGKVVQAQMNLDKN